MRKLKYMLSILAMASMMISFCACGPASSTSSVSGTAKKADTSSAASPDTSSKEDRENNAGTDDNTDSRKPAESQPLTYQMAQIGTDSGVSESKYSFDSLLRTDSSEDQTGVTYKSLSFVVQVPAAKDLYPSSIRVANRSTGENLEQTETAMLHFYKSMAPTDEYLAGHAFEPNGFLSASETDTIFTVMLITTEDLTFDDLLVSCTYLDAEGEKTADLEFNSTIDKIRISANYTKGSSLFQLGGDYYVLDAGVSGYGSGEGTTYASKDLVCVSSPFTFSPPTVDTAKVGLYSQEDLSPKTLPGGCEIFYEGQKDSPSVLNISVGIRVQGGGDLEAAKEIVYSSYPGLPTSNGVCILTGL